MSNRGLFPRFASCSLPDDRAVASRRAHSCAWPRLGERLLPQEVGRVGLHITIEMAPHSLSPAEGLCIVEVMAAARRTRAITSETHWGPRASWACMAAPESLIFGGARGPAKAPMELKALKELKELKDPTMLEEPKVLENP